MAGQLPDGSHSWASALILPGVLVSVLSGLYLVVRRCQRRALRPLVMSEERFRGLVALSSDWYWEQDDQLRFTFLSQDADARSGHSASASIGQTRWEHSGVDRESAEWEAHRALCLAHRPFHDFVYRRVGSDGAARWLSISGEPILGRSGRFKGYRGVGRDVTDRIEGEQRLRRLNELYDALSATNEVIIRAGDEAALFREVCMVLGGLGHFTLTWIGRVEPESGRVVEVACRGPCDEVMPILAVSAKSDVPDGQGAAGTAIREQRVQIIDDCSTDPRAATRLPVAERLHIRSSAAVPVIVDDAVAALIVLNSGTIGFFDEQIVDLLERMAQDLAYALSNLHRARERAEALDALSKSEEQFELVVRGANDGLWDWSLATGEVYYSPRFKALLGYSGDEFPDRYESFESHLHPDDRAGVEAALQAHFAGHATYETEYRLRNRSGEYRWFQARGQATWNAEGSPVRLTGAARDVTRRKESEQQIARLSNLYAALSQTNRAIIHLREPKALFEEVCRVANEYGHFCLAWIGLVDDAGWIEPMAIEGSDKAYYAGKGAIRVSIDPAIPEGRGVAGSVIREGRSQVVNDFFADARLSPWFPTARAAGVRSVASIPLRQGGRVVGVLNLHGSEVGFFTDELVSLLEEMALNISFALDTMQQQNEREAGRLALQASEEKFRLLASNIPEVFWIHQPGLAGMNYVSPAYERIWGRSVTEVMANPGDWIDAVHPEDRERVARTVHAALDGQFDHEYRIVRGDGCERWIHDRAFPIRDAAGNLALVTGIAEDVTERRAFEERLLHMAHYDSLTELPNRLLFNDRLNQCLAHAARAGRSTAVMFVDLDRFKLINDTFGHAVGDELLEQVGIRFTGALRAGDTVGRLGGDEFAIILADLASPDDAATIANNLMQLLEQPFELEGREVFISASAGITLSPADGTDADTLIKNADAAMYRAKEVGRGNSQFYKTEMNARSMERLALENDLRRALEREEFEVHYQPKVELSTGDITGVEALLRWNHPELGRVSPVRFIPILEDNGLIVPVGEWVLRAACRQISAWRAQGLTPVPVAVNLSARQLQQKDLAHTVRKILSDHGTEPKLIELEITESTLMRNPEHAVDMLRQLKAEGIRLAVDDFGTGYSSLAYLKSFPLDTLKIDRSFIKDIITTPDDALITRAVISMAHSLRLNVVAEGVEDEAQLAFLRTNGCDEMQGFLFSQAIPAGECGDLLRAGRQLPPPKASGDLGPTLLLVDDEVNILSSLKRLLRRDGYNILTASSAVEGFEALARNDVSVVISDQRMPDVTGVEFLRRVKDIYPNTIRIVLSGYTDLQTVTDAVNQGAVYKFFTKPWEDDQLRAHVKEAFTYKALLDENRKLSLSVRETLNKSPIALSYV